MNKDTGLSFHKSAPVMPLTRLKRLLTTSFISLTIIIGTSALIYPDLGATPSYFIRCEDPPGTRDSQCDGDITERCNKKAFCCASQYYSGGECDDSKEDIFICYGNKTGGGDDDIPPIDHE